MFVVTNRRVTSGEIGNGKLEIKTQMCRLEIDTLGGIQPLRRNVVIQLTRLNHQHFAVNSDLIKFIEKAPDTVVTLTTGEKIVVLETPELVIEKVIEFRRALMAGSSSGSVNPHVAVNQKHPDNEVHSPSETSPLG